MIDETAQRYGVETALVHAVVRAESDFDHLAISSSGAQGLMQLMPETARRYGVRDSMNPVDNIYGGVKYLRDLLTIFSQVALWTLMFFFASAAASSAYLTVSELFPLELRALAIAIFYSTGTAVGGIVGPWVFGFLIDSGSRGMLFLGYAVAAALMLLAALFEMALGVDAERRSLEEIAAPLSTRI